MAFDSDRAYSSTITTTGEVIWTVPASCRQRQGKTLSCVELEQSLELAIEGGSFLSGSCDASADDCACTLTLVPATTVESGTYATNGGALSQTSASGSESQHDYCANDSQLTLSPHADATAKSTAQISGTIVLNKRD